MVTLPSDAEPLEAEGWFAHVSDPTVYGWRVRIIHNGTNTDREFPVAEVQLPRYSHFMPGGSDDQYAYRLNPITSYNPHGGLPDDYYDAYGETLMLASRFVKALNEDNPLLAEAKRRRAEWEEQRRQEREEYERKRALRMEELRKIREEAERERERLNATAMARVNELFEQLKWLPDTQFRLKRNGYKSTVFGTIERFSGTRTDEDGEEKATLHTTMFTVSERGKHMRIMLRDVCWMEIKEDPSSRRFTNIYDDTKKEVTQ